MKKLLVLMTMLSMLSCKNSSDKDKSNFISVPSLIEEQVNHVDSSLYSITKYTFKENDSIPSDTFYIRREEFRNEATEFLNTLDLSIGKNAKRFNEETRYDELLKKVIITYTPVNAKDEELQKEEILVDHSLATGDKVKTIIINRAINNKDGYYQYDMLWLMDQSFQITKTVQKPGEKPVVITYKVIWNEQ